MARPREFDEEIVVAQITEVFWLKGYNATSMGDIVEATGLNRSSLYNTFGGKQELFRAVLDQYRAGPAERVLRPLLTLRGAEAISGLLEQLARFVASPEACRGCLMVNTVLEGVPDEEARAKVAAHFKLLRRGIERAWGEALSDETIDSTLTSREVSEWLVTFVRGTLVAAGSGESLARIRRSLKTAGKQLGLS